MCFRSPSLLVFVGADEMRGWCAFEDGIARIVIMLQDEDTAAGNSQRYEVAEASRPKLISLGDNGVSLPTVRMEGGVADVFLSVDELCR
jgi:hypothetical protein